MKTSIVSAENIPRQYVQRFIKDLYGEITPGYTIAPHFDQLFMVEDNGELKAVACGYDNPYHSNSYIVGNYESVPGDKYTKVLFQAIESRALSLEKTDIIGPMNGSTWHNYRFSTSTDHLFFLENIHKSYYLEQWKSAGFETFQKYQSSLENISDDYISSDPSAFFSDKNLTLNTFDIGNVEKQLLDIHAFCNRVFSDNKLFSPISKSDFLNLYRPVIPALNPDLIDLVYDRNEIVGLLFAVPDYYNKQQVIAKTIGRNPRPDYEGVAHYLSAVFHKKAFEMNFKTMIHAYFHVGNASQRISKNYGGKTYRKHVLLRKCL